MPKKTKMLKFILCWFIGPRFKQAIISPTGQLKQSGKQNYGLLSGPIDPDNPTKYLSVLVEDYKTDYGQTMFRQMTDKEALDNKLFTKAKVTAYLKDGILAKDESTKEEDPPKKD